MIPALLALGLGSGCRTPETSLDPATGEPFPHRFDAASVRPGMLVAGLEVAEVDLRQSAIDATFVGSVRFRGETLVGGNPFLLDSAPPLLCFRVDPASAGRLPRMRHDDRRVWFCFEDQERAQWLLLPLLNQPASIAIANFRTVYEFTDAFDTARLIGLGPDPDPGPAGPRAAGRVHRSARND